jgi:hypothetical protein
MKNIILISTALIGMAISISAQSSVSKDSIRYVSEEDDVYRLHQEKKALFKLLPLSYEHKISTSTSLAINTYSTTIISDILPINLNVNLAIEGRYYYQMKKRVDSGIQASNLSGKYLAFSAFRGFGIAINEDITDELNAAAGATKGLTLSLGGQKRIHDKFYWDNGFLTEYLNLKTGPDLSGFNAVTFTRKSIFGIVLFGDSKSQEGGDFLPSVKVHVNRKYALRFVENTSFTITRLSDFENFDPTWKINIFPHLVSELKISNSSFSFMQEFQTVIGFSNVENDVVGSLKMDKVLYRAQVGIRYYYNMKEKILTGEGGNNFTGTYVMAMLSHQNTSDLNSNLSYIIGEWGYQLEVGDGFFLNAGVNSARRVSGVRPDIINLGPNLLPSGIGIRLNIGRRIF